LRDGSAALFAVFSFEEYKVGGLILKKLRRGLAVGYIKLLSKIKLLRDSQFSVM
jgi:hypothetical protein